MTPYLKPGLMDIDDVIAQSFNTTKELMKSRSRLRVHADGRKFGMWYRLVCLGETHKSSGSHYGRDHSTVVWAKNLVPQLMKTDKFFKEKAERALKLLEQLKL